MSLESLFTNLIPVFRNQDKNDNNKNWNIPKTVFKNIIWGKKNIFIAIMVYLTINSDDMPYVNQVFNLNIYL